MRQIRPSPYLLTLVTALAVAIFGSLSASDDVIDEPIAEFDFDGNVLDVDWNGDGTLAYATSDGLYMVTQDFVFLAHIHAGRYLTSVSWSPTGTQLVLTNDRSFEIWNWDNLTNTLTLERTFPGNGPQQIVSWSPSGDYIAIVSLIYRDNYPDVGQIHLLNTTTWQQVTMPEYYLTDYMFSKSHVLDWHPSGDNRLAGVGVVAELEGEEYTAVASESAYIIDANTQTLTTAFRVAYPALSVAWRPNTSTIAVGHGSGITLYDMDTQQELLNYAAGFDNVALAWNFDGGKIIAGNVLIDVANDLILGQYAYLEEPIWAVDWRPDGGALVIGSGSGRTTVEDPLLARGFGRTITPTGDSTLRPTATATPGSGIDS